MSTDKNKIHLPNLEEKVPPYRRRTLFGGMHMAITMTHDDYPSTALFSFDKSISVFFADTFLD